MECSSGQVGYSTQIVCPPSGGGPDSGLPVTGAELGVFAGAGLVLVALGVGLRRLARKPA